MSEIENIAKQIVAKGKGILAADESTGTMTKRLSNVNVESGCQISGCMVGHNAHIGQNSNLADVVVDHGAIVPSGHVQNGGVFPTAS